MSGDGHEGSAERGVTIEYVLSLVGIGFVEREDGTTEVLEGVLHSLQDLGFV
jgi:hypothetical protein